MPIAGGTDLLVDWHHRLGAEEKTLLDLSRLAPQRSLEWTRDSLTLGALTTYWDVIVNRQARKEFPLLESAARQVGAIQIQSRGTWAGNIGNASPAADGVCVLMAYDATVLLASVDGDEEVPLSDYYLGYKRSRRRPEQLIRSIRIPRRRTTAQVFEKVGARRAQAITKVGLAICRSEAGWRVVAHSVAPTVRRCPSLEALLEAGAQISSPADLLPAIRQDVAPIDDLRSTAVYRETVLSRLFHSAVADRGIGRRDEP